MEILLNATPELMLSISSEIESQFFLNGYDICVVPYARKGKEISITKEGVFKSFFGSRTAFKIRLLPCEDGIWFKTSVGLYGNEEIPPPWSIILVPHTRSLVRKYRLEEKALAIAKNVICEFKEYH